MPAWTQRSEGLLLTVRVTPRSSRELLEAGTDEHLIARVTAPPTEGAANAAVIALVAATLDVPCRDVEIRRGATGRLKQVMVRGDAAALAQTARRLYCPAP